MDGAAVAEGVFNNSSGPDASGFLTSLLLLCIFTVIQLNDMFFKLNATVGQPLYLQLMQQIRHATETGALHDGDQLPGIRTLAEKLVVSPNTIAKAYSELEHEGLLELRHGSGAFVCVKRRIRSMADSVHAARRRIRDLIDRLRDDGLVDEEIRRAFEAELLFPVEIASKR
jgi:GntR family transcriptional regulator